MDVCESGGGGARMCVCVRGVVVVVYRCVCERGGGVWMCVCGVVVVVVDVCSWEGARGCICVGMDRM